MFYEVHTLLGFAARVAGCVQAALLEEEIDIEQQLSSLRQELENLGVDQIDDEYFSDYQLDSYGNYVSNDIEVPSFRGEGPGTRLPSNFVNLIKFCG